jgi:hypothetical protein
MGQPRVTVASSTLKEKLLDKRMAVEELPDGGVNREVPRYQPLPTEVKLMLDEEPLEKRTWPVGNEKLELGAMYTVTKCDEPERTVVEFMLT